MQNTVRQSFFKKSFNFFITHVVSGCYRNILKIKIKILPKMMMLKFNEHLCII